MPVATLDAFRAGGAVEATLEQEAGGSDVVLANAATAGLDLQALALTLVDEGVARFSADFQTLLASLERKRAEVQTGLPPLNPPRGDPTQPK